MLPAAVCIFSYFVSLSNTLTEKPAGFFVARQSVSDLVDRNGTGHGDDLIGVCGGDVVEERLSSLGKCLTALGHQDEGTLNFVAAVQDGFVGGNHTADGQGLDGVLYRGQGGVADGVGVGSH